MVGTPKDVNKTLWLLLKFSSTFPDILFVGTFNKALNARDHYFRLLDTPTLLATSSCPTLMDSSWEDLMPEYHGELWVKRTPERSEYFKEAKSTPGYAGLSPSLWAFPQVGDLEHIKRQGHLSDEQRWRAFADDRPGWEPQWEPRAATAMILWQQDTNGFKKAHASTKPPHTPTDRASDLDKASSPKSLLAPLPLKRKRSRSGHSKYSAGDQQASVGRDDGVKKSCKRRNNNLCVVSKMEGVDACHIYPWCSFREEHKGELEDFWDILKLFWSPEKVNVWKRKMVVDENEHDRGTDTVTNMLTLTATLNRFHSAGALALLLVRKSLNNNKLELEFHWLVREGHHKSDGIDLLDELDEFDDDEDEEPVDWYDLPADERRGRSPPARDSR